MDTYYSCPLVSVIIPTLNRPNLLIRALDSVAFQTYPYIEIIIVDDGSKYDIEALIRSRTNLYNYRVLKNKQRQGGATARNIGFYKSKGSFIGFLDDDDEWMATKIEKQVKAFQRSDEKVGIVCTHDMQLSGKRRVIRYRYLEGNVYRTLCRGHVAGNTSNPLIKRHVLNDVGLFDEDMPAAQDTDLWLRIAKKFHFTTVTEPLVLIHREDFQRISENNYKQFVGVYKLLRKHWKDFHIFRKYELIRSLCRLSIVLCLHRFH